MWQACAQVLSAKEGAQDLRAVDVAKQLWRSAGEARQGVAFLQAGGVCEGNTFMHNTALFSDSIDPRPRVISTFTSMR